MRPRALAAVMLTLILVTVVGCGTGSNGTKISHWSMRNVISQSGEREIVSALPEGLVADINQMDKGSFLQCSPDGAQRWSSHLTATIHSDPLPGAVMDALADYFSAKERYAIGRRTHDGEPLLDIATAFGFLSVLRYCDDRDELSVDSFSACLRMPDDIWPGSPC